MEQEYFKNITKKSTSLVIAIVLMFILLVFSVNLDIIEWKQQKEIGIPHWFFWIIFSVDALIVISLVLLALYRKIGAIGTPILAFAHFLMNVYFLSAFIYSDLFFLFVFFCAGLFSIVPRWKFFK